MTEQQKHHLLALLHSKPFVERKKSIDSEIKHFGISEVNIESEISNVENEFANGIKNLNANQLNNLMERVQRNGLEIESLRERLFYYDISEDFHQNIFDFFHSYFQSYKPVDVGELDTEFKGVQVASRDDFNKIINQGWTGDWTLNPDNINPLRVQIASMNESGNFPRGFYLNADISKIEAIPYGQEMKYKLFISNPVIINTGNKNVKFIAQPVRYIR